MSERIAADEAGEERQVTRGQAPGTETHHGWSAFDVWWTRVRWTADRESEPASDPIDAPREAGGFEANGWRVKSTK